MTGDDVLIPPVHPAGSFHEPTRLETHMTNSNSPATAAPRLASYSSPDHQVPSRLEHAWYLPILAVCALADAINFKMAFGLLYRGDDDTTLWILVVAAAIGALIAADFAGREAKMRSVGDLDANIVTGRVAVLFWAGLGLTAFYVRMITPPPTASSVVTFGGQSAPTAVAGWQIQLPAALLFLFVYGICGVVAYLSEYHRYNPRRTRLLKANRADRRARGAHVKAQSAVVRAQTHHADRLQEKAAWQARHAAVIDGHFALARDAKAHARAEIARHLGDPSATSALLDSADSDGQQGRVEPIIRSA